MSMTLYEARKIAHDKTPKHAPATYDLAAHLLLKAGEPGLRQLCEIKACIERGDIAGAARIGN
jgi:hypothetical protein